MFFLAGWAFLLIYYNSFGAFKEKVPVPLNQITEIGENYPTPTVAPTMSPIPTLTPTEEPTPTPSPKPIIKSESPTPTKALTNVPSDTSGDIGLTLMRQINDFRAGKGLGPFSTDGNTCGFAVTRAGEIISGFNHDGFSTRVSGHTLPYPTYHEVAENIAMNSEPNAVVTGWINSPGHNENLSKDVPFACVGKNGNYYAFEAWKP